VAQIEALGSDLSAKVTVRELFLWCVAWCMGLLSVPVLARELTAVKVEVSSVAVGSTLGVRIELNSGNRCGAVLSFGDGSSQELMLEADAGASVN